MWFTFGLFVLLLWAIGAAFGAGRRVQMLYNECVTLNTRWRATSEFLVRKALRDAIKERPEWTPQDEEALRESAERLEQLGVSLQSLGIASPEVTACSDKVVH